VDFVVRVRYFAHAIFPYGIGIESDGPASEAPGFLMRVSGGWRAISPRHRAGCKSGVRYEWLQVRHRGLADKSWFASDRTGGRIP
jgi:hypothetical protein